MSWQLMQSVIRAASRCSGTHDPETIERREQLETAIVLVFVFHMMMVVGFIKLQDFEGTHRRIIVDSDVIFELTPPPPEPRIPRMLMPRLANYTAGGNVGGSEFTLNRMANKKPVPASRTQQIQSAIQSQAPVRKPDAPKWITPAPISVTSPNEIKVRESLAEPTLNDGIQKIAVSPTGPNTLITPFGNIDGHTAPAATTIDGVSDGTGGRGIGAESVEDGMGAGTTAGEQQITTTLKQKRALIGISEYFKRQKLRVVRNWHPAKRVTGLIIAFAIARDGSLVSVQVKHSSGNRHIDRKTIEAFRSTEFEPLPEAYKGEQIEFELAMSYEER